MANQTTLGEAAIPIRAALDKLDQDLASAKGKVSSAIDGIVGNVQKVGSAALAGVGVVGGVATAAAAALGKLAIDAAPVEGLRDAFEGLAESSGSSMDAMLAALQAGSSGMVSQRDLMASYNQAAQLVSTTFANQLPDAMGYLSKVSAATGQDMGFMLDSLVKGVGRLSPMILDNLGIQVSQAEATERAAEMYGVEAEALDKAQLQAGMMNVVLEKLAANTASMPDVTDSAAAGLAQMKAKFQDTKDQLGTAFLPVLTEVMSIIGELAERFLPPLLEAFERIAPIIADVATRIGGFVGAILDGQDPISALREMLTGLVPPEVVDTIMGIVAGIQEFIVQAQETLAPVMEWISQNVELEDVLIALGLAIAAVVVPALISVVTTAAPIIATAAALIAAVVLVRQAWESDFLGIRTFVENTLTQIKTWWAEHGDSVIAKANAIYEKVKEGIETALTVVKAVIQTALGMIKAWWAEHGETIMTVVRNAWDTIKTVVETVINNVKDIIEAVSLAIEGDWHGFGEKIRDIWDRTWAAMARILSNAWDNIKIIVGELVQSIIAFFRDTDWKAVGKGIIQGIIEGVKRGVGALADAVKAAAKAALEAAKGFLGIDSPSKVFQAEVALPSVEGWVKGLEAGIAQIRGASGRLAEASVDGGRLSGAFGAAAGAGLGGVVVHNHFGADSVRSEADIYRLAEKLERSLNLRGLQKVFT